MLKDDWSLKSCDVNTARFYKFGHFSTWCMKELTDGNGNWEFKHMHSYTSCLADFVLVTPGSL